MRAADKERVRVEVTSRIVSERIADFSRGGMPLENLLNDTLYKERKRLERESNSMVRTQDLQFWNTVGKSLGHASDDEIRSLLRRVADRYVSEILGNFNEAFYQMTSSFLPVALGAVLNGLSPSKLMSRGLTFPNLEESVIMDGEVELLQKLQTKGCILLLPTHSSHMDSILIGWALHRLGLPPFLYGAGLNLFSNPIMGFFMGNLGAYRVDRKKRNDLYKSVLKAYATYAVELGYNNLFFPGGTRSRSGAVEQHLKLGLAGTGIEAYIRRLLAGRVRPQVYVVPCTLSYPLVLESETLVDDFLKETGKARYIITDDEFSRPRRVLGFLRDLVQHEARMRLRIGAPMDVFGNRVDEDGASVDGRGRVIDTSRYVLVDGVPCPEPSRDAEYTREMGAQVRRSFMENNTALSTHILSFATFRVLTDSHPDLDLYRLLRTGGDAQGLSLTRMYGLIDHLMELLKDLQAKGKIAVDPDLLGLDAREIVAAALRYFGSYHSRRVLERRGDRLFAGDMNLLFYYHNRLTGYGLEALMQPLTTRRAL